MSDILLEREFAVSPARLFRAISEHADLIRWWGHDGWTMVSEELDFTRTGPWHADMRSDEGNPYKLSGHVTRVNAPESIGFTWAWHDPEDKRGAESHVTLTVVETAKGSKLIVDHRELPSDDIAQGHMRGWSATLVRLIRLMEEET